MDRLLRHAWPGNVRELMNAVERGVVLARTEYLDEAEMPLIPAGAGTDGPPPGAIPDVEIPLEEVEKAAILKSLAAAEGNKSEAARRLGITRRTLHQKLKKWRLM
jgi:two-component system response regulator HydG